MAWIERDVEVERPTMNHVVNAIRVISQEYPEYLIKKIQSTQVMGQWRLRFLLDDEEC